MSISFVEILEDDIFAGAEVIAGEGGLRRDIRRVSVFDCRRVIFSCHAWSSFRPGRTI